MAVRVKLAFVCYALVALGATVFGLVYLLRSEPMVYHQAMMGVAWGELSPGVRTVMMALLTGTGMGFLVNGLALWILLLGPFRRGDAWARWAIPVVGLSGLVPATYMVWRLSEATGVNTPWWLAAGGSLLLVVGWVLSKDAKGPAG